MSRGMRLTSTISSSLELSSASIETSVVSGSVSLPFPLTSVFSAGADILTVVLCYVGECGVVLVEVERLRKLKLFVLIAIEARAEGGLPSVWWGKGDPVTYTLRFARDKGSSSPALSTTSNGPQL